jgi:putative phosphoribosyl transferase
MRNLPDVKLVPHDDDPRDMLHEADAIVCLKVPARFDAVGKFFMDFSQVSDDEVIAILREHESKALASGQPRCLQA